MKTIATLTAITVIIVLASCQSTVKTETKYIRSIDSVELKAKVKGWYLKQLLTGIQYHLNRSYFAIDSTTKKNHTDTLLFGITKIDSLFSDTTLNPIFKK